MLMQWVNPKTEKKGLELANSTTIAVEDVGVTLEVAKKTGFEVTKPIEYIRLPVLGGVMIGRVLVELGSSPVEFW